MSTRPPGPTGEPLLGNSRRYADDPFGFMRACADAYGDIVRFDLGPMETYMLTNPDDIQRVLVDDAERYRKPEFDSAMDDLLGDGLLTSDGDAWRRQRRLADPAFHVGRLRHLDGMMTDHAESMLAGWEAGDRIDVQLEMARLTVRIIVNAMFGTDIDGDRVRAVQEHLEPLGARFEPDPRQVVVPDWAPTRKNREFADAVDALEDVLDGIVADRRGSQHDPSIDPAAGPEPAGESSGTELPMDLLSVLLRARDRGEQTDENLRDELMTMLLAGHDTTALTLTYTWYLLSEHPAVRERVHAEIDGVLGADPRTPTADDVRELEFTGRVVDEAMRLYPPVYTMFRESEVDVKLGGYRVPAGSAIMLPQWVVHRSPRWYDDPGRFDPDRWRPERRGSRPRFSFFPFGGGPRRCIGKQFALLEAKLILASVASRYELDYVGPEMELRGSLTMHPRHPVPAEITRRE